jgi:hypothetical protein
MQLGSRLRRLREAKGISREAAGYVHDPGSDLQPGLGPGTEPVPMDVLDLDD